jgi:hypothetical protein
MEGSAVLPLQPIFRWECRLIPVLDPASTRLVQIAVPAHLAAKPVHAGLRVSSYQQAQRCIEEVETMARGADEAVRAGSCCVAEGGRDCRRMAAGSASACGRPDRLDRTRPVRGAGTSRAAAVGLNAAGTVLRNSSESTSPVRRINFDA